MKKKMIALIVCMGLLCMVLVGCAGSDPAKKFIGYWELSAIPSSEGTGAEEISMMKAFGLTASITLNEDKSASLDIFGEKINGTWKAKDEKNATFTYDGADYAMTLADGTLSMTVEGDTLEFVQGTAPAASSSSNSSSSSESASAGSSSASSAKTAMNVVLADDDVCTITVTGKETDSTNDPGFDVTITNKTSKDIGITTGFDDWNVNGTAAMAYLDTYVEAGTTQQFFLYFSAKDLGGGTEKLTNVTGTLEVFDVDTVDTLATYPVSL